MVALGCDRIRAKNTTYGTLYGAGPFRLSQLLTTAGFPTSIPSARALQTRFFSLYPDLAAWRSQVIRQGASYRFIRNVFGRRRWFHSCYISPSGDVEGAEIPEMYDYLPQSTAADIMWAGLRPVDSAIRQCGGNLLAQIHDSFLCELPPGAKPRGIIDAMQTEFPQIAPGFRVPVAAKSGPNWGEMTPWTT
jgi:DNA polymerase I-like protein with 3'-5' exonuclease and polymerase domains